MDSLLFILGIILTFISGILCHASIHDNSVSSLAFILLLLFSCICLLLSTGIALENSNYLIEALNGTLQYDTVSLDKNGKLLDIKIK